jgi:hypothetical protein
MPLSPWLNLMCVRASAALSSGGTIGFMLFSAVLKRVWLSWPLAVARGGRVSVPGHVVVYWHWGLLKQSHCCGLCVVGFLQGMPASIALADVWT